MTFKSTLFLFSGQFCVLYVIMFSSWRCVSSRPSSQQNFFDREASCWTKLGYCVILVLFWVVRIFSYSLSFKIAVFGGFCLYEVKQLKINVVIFFPVVTGGFCKYLRNKGVQGPLRD